jgi:hypothetical protein
VNYLYFFFSSLLRPFHQSISPAWSLHTVCGLAAAVHPAGCAELGAEGCHLPPYSCCEPSRAWDVELGEIGGRMPKKKGGKSPSKKAGSKKTLTPAPTAVWRSPVWERPPTPPPKIMELPVDVKIAAEVGDLARLRSWLFVESGHVDATFDQPPTPKASAAARTGVTMLMAASAAGQMRAVVLLLDNGANVNTQDSHGNSALMIASQRRDGAAGSHEVHDQIASYLLRQGARVDLYNRSGASARSVLPYSTGLVLKELEGNARGSASHLSLAPPPGLGGKGRGQAMADLSITLIQQRPTSSHSRLPYLRLGRQQMELTTPGT